MHHTVGTWVYYAEASGVRPVSAI